MKMYQSIILFLSVILYVPSCTGRPVDSGQDDIWPGETWERSTPEEQGIDSKILLKGLKELDLATSGINSMVIIRNGYIVAEFYRQPFTNSIQHRINSCTKSFISALFGIVIDDGLIKNIKQPVLLYFNEIKSADPKSADITIEDLLTMQSGFQWNISQSYFNPKNDGRLYQIADSRIEFIFSKQVIQKPGTVFRYNSMNSQLLADIIHRATNQQSGAYAKEKLLEPIGITKWSWQKAANGSISGGTGLSMRTEDLARLGYLYLHEGMWNGNRIISKEWVRDSVSIHTSTFPKTTTNRILPVPYYGYQWWVWDKNIYMASGGSGQLCYVNKRNDVVVAINSYADSEQEFRILNFLLHYGVPGMVVSDSPLPANSTGVSILEQYLESAGEATPVGTYINEDLLKQKIDGKVISFKNNEINLGDLTFHFSDNKVTTNSSFRTLNSAKRTGEEQYNIGKEYQLTTYSFAQNNLINSNNYVQYGRVTDLDADSIKYESIYAGPEQMWVTYELHIEASKVTLTKNILKYGVNQPDSIAIYGQLTE